MKNFRKSYAFSSIAFILVGLALLLWPALSLRLVCGLFGLVILIKGISSLVGYARSEVRTVFHYFGWVFGAAATALGVFLLIKPETVVSVLPILVGLIVIFDGVMRIQSALELRNAGYQQPPAADYQLVYDGEICCPLEQEEQTVLERIFRLCNDSFPNGYVGRSLSPSDVVELYGENGRRYFYCDTNGFVPVQFSPMLAKRSPRLGDLVSGG